jgi:hypothetical protein
VGVDGRVAGVPSSDDAQPSSCVPAAATASIAERRPNSRRENALPIGSAVESAPDWKTPVSGFAGSAPRIVASAGDSSRFRVILVMGGSHLRS